MVGSDSQEENKQTRFSVTVTLEDIYECLCPACRLALLNLIAQNATKGVVFNILERQMERKPDGS